MSEISEFRPNWISSPGETIADVLKEKRISVTAFSKRIGCSVEETKDLLTGKISITLSLARRLQSELGSSAEFWVSRDFHYRNTVARLSDVETRDWLKELPVSDMVRFGWIKPVSPPQEFAACLRFFDTPDVTTWRKRYASLQRRVAFKASQSFESRAGAVAAWLRQGEIEAGRIRCKPWSPELFSSTLANLRRLTTLKHPDQFLPKLRDICASCGVAMVVVRAPNGCRASGATYFASDKRAVLQLSFRHLSDDQFWFSFFHEVGHLFLHGRDGFFLEGINTSTTLEEQEANNFAQNVLIPPAHREEMLRLRPDHREVIRFAHHMGISPGIIVGQLQHSERLKKSHLNGLKRRFTWNN